MTNNEMIIMNAKEIGGKKFAQLPVDELIIDATYQRKLRSKIKRMTKNWDYNLCDVILVSFRNDKFYVVDGQHRVEAARQQTRMKRSKLHLRKEIKEKLRFAGEAVMMVGGFFLLIAGFCMAGTAFI